MSDLILKSTLQKYLAFNDEGGLVKYKMIEFLN